MIDRWIISHCGITRMMAVVGVTVPIVLNYFIMLKLVHYYIYIYCITVIFQVVSNILLCYIPQTSKNSTVQYIILTINIC